jgi:hypothetical protein
MYKYTSTSRMDTEERRYEDRLRTRFKLLTTESNEVL